MKQTFSGIYEYRHSLGLKNSPRPCPHSSLICRNILFTLHYRENSLFLTMSVLIRQFSFILSYVSGVISHLYEVYYIKVRYFDMLIKHATNYRCILRDISKGLQILYLFKNINLYYNIGKNEI